jgi:hypothetical protein
MVPLVEDKIITQPFGDRSKVVIEPMLTDQWFVDTAKIVGPALDAVRDGRTTIVPEQHRKVYFHWLENIEPWTISRQLWWGHQIPVWYGFDLAAHGFRDDEGDGALDEVEMLRLLNAQTLLEGEDRHHCAPISTPSRAVRRCARPVAHAAEPCARGRGRRPARGGARAGRVPCAIRDRPGPDEARLPRLARPGRARHVVLLRALAHRHARLARGDGGAEAIFPDLDPDLGLRHHLLLGRPDDDDAAGRDRRGAVPRRLCPRARPGREGAEDVQEHRQRARPAGTGG